VVKNKLQFRGLNFIQKLDDGLKKLINISECTIFKKCIDMTEKPEVRWRQVMTVWRMKNSNEGIVIQRHFVACEE
jgi:hypothetical protein